jgi:protein ImuB
LPVSALRLDITTISLLGEVGIDSIGGALRLTGKSLAAGFPPLLSRRLAEFRGTVAEPITPPGGESLPQESCAFDFPLRAADVHEELLIGTIAPLIDRCLTPLASRGTGVLSLQVRLEHGSRLASAAPTVIDVGLFRPSVSRAHLVELVRLRLARVRLPAEIDGIAVEVVAAGPVACRQRTLFGPVEGADNSFEAADADVEVGMLLDRLSGRLGRPAVFEPQLVGDAQPEHAWIAAPPRNHAAPPRNDTALRRDRGGRVGTSAPRGDAFLRHTPAGRRPIWMPPRPLPLESIEFEMVSVAADGPPVRFRLGDRTHRIVQAHGPERIETAWWRGPSVRRDYYVVETESGERFWVFRRLKDGGWFFHGMFA